MAEDLFMFRNLRFAHRMRPIRLSFMALLVTACALSWDVRADAGVIIDIMETGGNVVVNFSGQFARPDSGTGTPNTLQPGDNGIEGGNTSSNLLAAGSFSTSDQYTTGLVSPSGSSWGSGTATFINSSGAATFSGSIGGLAILASPTSAVFSVNSNYSDNTPFTGSMTFTGQTLASMFLTPQTIVYSFAGSLVATPSTVTVNIVGAPPAGVPEPASLLLLSSIGLAGGYRQFRRKSRRQVAATAPQA